MHKHSSLGLLALSLAFLTLAGRAGAQPGRDVIHVQKWFSTGCTWPCAPLQYCEDLYDEGELITVALTNTNHSDECVYRINIWAENAAYSIGSCLITTTSTLPPGPAGHPYPEYLEIFIGQGAFPYTFEQTPAAAVNFAELSIPNPYLLERTRFAGHISGNLAGVTVCGRLYRLDIGGQLVGGLTAKVSPPSEQLFRVFANSTDLYGIGATSGSITRVEITNALAGSVVANDGGIFDVVAGTLTGSVQAGDFIRNISVTGAIGSSTPAVIRTLDAGAPIELIQATSINAEIETALQHPTMRGNIKQIKATSGNLSGSINALSLSGTAVGVPGIEVAGSLTSPINLAASNGLQRQIIVNGGNGSGTWTGVVNVGGTLLNPMPYYTNTSSSIGGGSVGLAPFHLHDEDCVPANGYSGAPPLDNNLRLRWYGPLSWNPASGDPVTVGYRSGSSGPYTDITDYFDYSINPSNPRELLLEANSPLDLAYVEYLVTPTSNLKCSGVTGSPAVYNGDTYHVAFQ